MSLYHIRWALYWSDRQKFGVWSMASPYDVDKPSSQNLTGLLRAEIHSKPVGGGTSTDRVVVCPGDAFKEFQFIAQVRHNFISNSTAAPEIIGISIVKKDDKKISYFKDGTLKEKG